MKTGKKVNRINIYLTSKEKMKMIEIKNKYHVSFSTIAEICLKYLKDFITEQQMSTPYNIGGSKTSIKPRSDEDSKKYNSVLFMFLNDKGISHIKDYGNRKSMIYNELQNTYEENWNGNYLHRILPRIIKANPKYIKKVLEEC